MKSGKSDISLACDAQKLVQCSKVRVCYHQNHDLQSGSGNHSIKAKEWFSGGGFTHWRIFAQKPCEWWRQKFWNSGDVTRNDGVGLREVGYLQNSLKLTVEPWERWWKNVCYYRVLYHMSFRILYDACLWLFCNPWLHVMFELWEIMLKHPKWCKVM